MIEYLDMLCNKVSPDIVPLLAGGDPFIDAVEYALMAFLRDGAVSHVLGRAPYAFEKFNRACALFDGLFCKLFRKY